MSEVNFGSEPEITRGATDKEVEIWYEEGDIIDIHHEGYSQTGL